MTVIKSALTGLFLAVGATEIGAQTETSLSNALKDFEKRFPPVAKNGAAEEVERLALVLGVGQSSASSGDNRSQDRPAREDQDAYRQAQFRSWLESQIKASDDSVSPLAPRQREFLDRRRATLERLIALLIREVPEWGFGTDTKLEPSQLLLVNSVGVLLLSAALAQEREGRHDEAEQFLEASWSLYESIARRPELISQLVAIGLAKLQAGALRKMAEPGLEWLERMSGGATWQNLLDSYENDPLTVGAAEPGVSNESFLSAWLSGRPAAADDLRERSVCQVSKLPVDELWEPVRRELTRWKEEGVNTDQASEVFKDISADGFLQALRRAARLCVELELTGKILELRQEKAASRDKRWPARFLDTSSTVCPEAHYEYAARGATMTIRFKGSIEDPGSPALVLPLFFEAKAPMATATPTRTVRPTVTPHP